MLTENKSVRLLAFYLPQFYPIPENDLWWGKGFTEWTNAARALPVFPGHYQPHMPADLGFYDLRVFETREAQADLAREYGIHGFVYFHYWFEGRRLLERPFDEVLKSGRPNFPFCLCWANHNWTRAWDGLEREVLLAQNYSEEDDRRHLCWLARAFEDPRYIRVNGRPLFIVYRASELPDPRAATSIWREEAHKLGAGEIYLARWESNAKEVGDPSQLGFDAAIDSQPSFYRYGRRFGLGLWLRALNRLGIVYSPYQRNVVFDYAAVVEKVLSEPAPPYKRFPCVTPSWDSTPRRPNNSHLLRDSTPQLYEKWLRGTIEKFVPPSPDENLVFINAWNEWGEGNHLEPCRKWGHAYLEATRNAVLGARSAGTAAIPASQQRERAS